MNRIIQDLLDIASIEAGKLSIRAERTDIAALLEQAWPAIEALTASHTFEFSVGNGMPPVYADKERIAQVLANLVGNAAKFTPPGAIIALRAEREPGGGVRFSVRDEGSGIAAADLPHVFDRFWHTRGSSIKRGTGLGLAISRGIVQAHGGEIWVESDEGHGAVFYFTVPEESPR
jgi:signal transduction histidine kinase